MIICEYKLRTAGIAQMDSNFLLTRNNNKDFMTDISHVRFGSRQWPLVVLCHVWLPLETVAIPITIKGAQH